MPNESIVRLLNTALKIMGQPAKDSINNNIPLRGIFLVCFTLFVPLNGVVNMYCYWTDVYKRFLVFQDTVISLCSLIFISDIIFRPRNYQQLIEVIDFSAFIHDKYIEREIVHRIIDQSNRFSWKLISLMVAGMVTFFTFACGVPLCNYVGALIDNEKINDQIIAMPFPSFTPLSTTTAASFSIVFFCQIIALGVLLAIVLSWLLMESCVLIHLSFEIELLCFKIENMDRHLMANKKAASTNDDLCVEYDEVYLRAYFLSMYNQHLTLIRKTKQVNNTLNVSLFLYNQLTILVFSMELYCMLQNNEATERSQYIVAYITTICDYGIFCFMGQLLINMSDRLQNTLISCSWRNKPLWFKHNVRMLLFGTSRHLELKPAGLYVMNINFLVKVLQASYSYCNIVLHANNSNK